MFEQLRLVCGETKMQADECRSVGDRAAPAPRAPRPPPRPAARGMASHPEGDLTAHAQRGIRENCDRDVLIFFFFVLIVSLRLRPVFLSKCHL